MFRVISINVKVIEVYISSENKKVREALAADEQNGGS